MQGFVPEPYIFSTIGNMSATVGQATGSTRYGAIFGFAPSTSPMVNDIPTALTFNTIPTILFLG